MRESLNAVLTIAVVVLGVCAVSWTATLVNGQATGTITGIIRCGFGAGCGSVAYGNPIDVAGSVTARRADAPSQDVTTSFTATDHGSYRLELSAGIYNLTAVAVGYNATNISHLAVGAGSVISVDFYLRPCPSSGCVAVPEFATPMITALMAFVALMTMNLIVRRMRLDQRIMRARTN
jgi:hypothetical protein